MYPGAAQGGFDLKLFINGWRFKKWGEKAWSRVSVKFKKKKKKYSKQFKSLYLKKKTRSLQCRTLLGNCNSLLCTRWSFPVSRRVQILFFSVCFCTATPSFWRHLEGQLERFVSEVFVKTIISLMFVLIDWIEYLQFVHILMPFPFDQFK